MADFIAKELYKIKPTQVMTQRVKPVDLHIEMQYRTEEGFIASNRLDAFVAQACKLSGRRQHNLSWERVSLLTAHL